MPDGPRKTYRRVGQQPKYRGLHELLTGPEALGLVVRFDCGLRYTVGAGFVDPRGEPVPAPIAHAVLGAAFRALGPAGPSRIPTEESAETRPAELERTC